MPFLQRMARLTIGLAAVVLAGCASNILETSVSSLQDWPADSHAKTFAFEQDYKADLEKKSYADLIAKAMIKNNLRQASSLKKAQYIVSFKALVKREKRSKNTITMMPSLFLGNSGFGGFSWLAGMNIGFSPRSSTEVIPYKHYELAIKIQNKQGASIYQANATIDATDQSTLSDIMPFLVDAVFDGFPNRNAKTRVISFDIDKSIEHNTPIKVQSDNKH